MLALKQHTLWNVQGLPAGARMLAKLKSNAAAVTGLRAIQADLERDAPRAETL